MSDIAADVANVKEFRMAACAGICDQCAFIEAEFVLDAPYMQLFTASQQPLSCSDPPRSKIAGPRSAER